MTLFLAVSLLIMIVSWIDMLIALAYRWYLLKTNVGEEPTDFLQKIFREELNKLEITRIDYMIWFFRLLGSIGAAGVGASLGYLLVKSTFFK